MPVRPIEDAHPIFEPFIDEIVDRCQRAYDRYLGDMGAALSRLSTRTKRSAVRDLMVDELRSWAEETPGVVFLKSGNLQWFGFANNWIVRIKALDDKDCVAVSPTFDSDSYDRNDLPDSIAEGLLEEGEATALYLGWRTNENAPTTPELSLVCNNSEGKPEWVWALANRTPPPEQLQLLPSDGGSPNTGVSIKVRRKKASNEG